jgi:hypothetical protein
VLVAVAGRAKLGRFFGPRLGVQCTYLVVKEPDVTALEDMSH